MKAFKKILIANRGEIACRIIRTLKQIQITAVVVYTDADRFAQHVKQADEAYYLGPSPPKESYLDGAKILAIAKAHQIDAIHPGYGFLSENADFAEACAKANIVFIGPPPDAIRQMGSKAAAKALMVRHQVPTLPAYFETAQDEKILLAAANKIGFPVLIKASYGGGGRGMRIVEKEQDFTNALASAQREALNNFGNSEVILEKYLVEPRHVEVQIFADHQGNVVYLFERDCSIQRRHQKIVEEAPAPNISDSLRQKMGEAAVRAAKAIHYVGAGTIEFLLDAGEQFYFMEMNTRLQVEHPVTEKIVNEDLVAWQIKVAQGERLPKLQNEIFKRGAAIEVRLCAEDPYHNFLPATGEITRFDYPRERIDVRVDTGYVKGDTVSIYYDSLLAKIITWGENRESARRLLLKALSQTEVLGVKTNRAILCEILQQPDFINAQFSTHFIAKHEAKILAHPPTAPEVLVGSVLYLADQLIEKKSKSSDPWEKLVGFRIQETPHFRFYLGDHEGNYQLQCIKDDLYWRVMLSSEINCEAYIINVQNNCYQFIMNQELIKMEIWQQGDHLIIHWQNKSYELHVQSRFGETLDEASFENQLTAPMPGKIIHCMVELNTLVKAGQPLLIMEAMKMEHTIRGPFDGVVSAIHCQQGDIVTEGTQLIEVTAF